VLDGRSGRGPVLDPRAPLAVLHAQRVVCCSPAAHREGVRVGQRKRQAQGACPHLVIVPHDPDRDARRYEPVVRSIGTLAPLLDVESPGCLLLATRGPSRYVGALALDGLADAHVAGGGVGVGIADGRFAATLAARLAAARGASVIVPAPDTASFLASHGVGVLADVGGCDPALVDLLARLGLERLGDVAALSPVHLVDRFGALGERLHRLVTGTDDAAPSAVAPPDDPAVQHEFDDPVPQIDPLVFSAKSLADRVDAYGVDRGLVCTRVLVEAHSDHGEVSRRVWYRADGLRAAALVDRVRWQLDGWINGSDPPSAGVVLLRLVPTDLRRDSGTQMGFWGERSQADDAAVRAITRLIGLLGPRAVDVASWRGGRDPHQVYELVPVAELGSDDRRAIERPTEVPPWPGSLPAPSPSLVYAEPVGVEVIDADNRTVSVSGRGTASGTPTVLVRGGRSHEIVSWAGPWPVDERWWDIRARRAARFQLLVTASVGLRAYLAEVVAGQWWLVAEYQ
jgi:protein ImuB